MEVPWPGIKSKLHWRPTPQLWQDWILNPLLQVGDQTSNTETSQVINPGATVGTPISVVISLPVRGTVLHLPSETDAHNIHPRAPRAPFMAPSPQALQAPHLSITWLGPPGCSPQLSSPEAGPGRAPVVAMGSWSREAREWQMASGGQGDEVSACSTPT